MPRRLRNPSRGTRQARTTARPKKPSASTVPSFQSTFTVSKTLRFNATSAALTSNTPIAASDILQCMVMAATAILPYQLFSAVRLRRVKIWGPVPSALTPVTVSVQFPADVGATATQLSGPSKIYSDTVIGSTKAAFVSCAPPSGSLSAMWQSSAQASVPLFILNGPVGSIVDISVDLVLQNGETPVQGAATIGATVGQIYCRDLDKSGSSQLSPVSYTTIA